MYFFEICDRKIEFSEETMKYNEVKRVLINHIYGMEIYYKQYYKLSVTSFNSLFSKAFPQMIEIINDTVDLAYNILVKNGVTYLDRDTFAAVAVGETNWDEVLNIYFDFANEINEYKAKLELERNLKYADQKIWYGGGFGIKGAIKGVVTAEALNLGTSALKGIASGLAKSSNNNKITKIKAKFMSENDAYEDTKLALMVCLDGIVTKVIKLLEEDEIIKEVVFTKEQRQKYNLACEKKKEQIKTYSDYEEVIDSLCNAIEIYPWNSKAYFSLFEICPEESEKILIMLECFGISIPFMEKIYEKLNKACIELNSKKLNKMEDVKNKYEEIKKIKETYHFAIDEYNKIYNNYLDNMEMNICFKAVMLYIQDMRKPIDNAIEREDLEYVWTEIENGNIYAEYACERYYFNKYGDNVIHSLDTHDKETMAYKLNTELKEKMRKYKYGKYLFKRIWERYYDLHYRETGQMTDFIELADIGIISAMYYTATKSLYDKAWKNRISYKIKGKVIEYIEMSAKVAYPYALLELGEWYILGANGIEENKTKGVILLVAAAAFETYGGKKAYDSLYLNNWKKLEMGSRKISLNLNIKEVEKYVEEFIIDTNNEIMYWKKKLKEEKEQEEERKKQEQLRKKELEEETKKRKKAILEKEEIDLTEELKKIKGLFSSFKKKKIEKRLEEIKLEKQKINL